MLELIRRMLEAGIMDGKELVFPEKGSPQGSVISPLLANVYLHEVLDNWFAEVVAAHCRGKVVMIRYADDFVIGCELARTTRTDHERPAAAVREVSVWRLNEEKTRMIAFHRPRSVLLAPIAWPEAGHVQFLGLYPLLGQDPQGWYTIKWKTDGRRSSGPLSTFWQWCREPSSPPGWRTSTKPCVRSCEVTTSTMVCLFNSWPWNRCTSRRDACVALLARPPRRPESCDGTTFNVLSPRFVLPSPAIVHGWDKMEGTSA